MKHPTMAAHSGKNAGRLWSMRSNDAELMLKG
jgi:hypothetical protein